ncbi:MAG: hypothetical protein RL300_1430 [Pseudomonadota bacterium]
MALRDVFIALTETAVANPSSSKAKVKPVAPKLVEIIDSTIYGDIWERPELSKRDRSMITMAALIGMRQTDQLRSHMEKALDNGVSAQEMGEIITHLAFYAGFPASLSAALVARPLLQELGLIEQEGKQ